MLAAAAGSGSARRCCSAALWIGWQVGAAFTIWLDIYLALTLLYTFLLKRKILVDALTLAALYTLRILAGGAAVGIWPGFWLLAFSLFLFLSLAFVKRYSELAVHVRQGRRRHAGPRLPDHRPAADRDARHRLRLRRGGRDGALHQRRHRSRCSTRTRT